MWGKWIGCTVPEAARGRFAEAQRGWSAIGGRPGLVGQVGGWDGATGRAHVLALWADEEAYGRFMREQHDAVFAATGQGGSYTAIEVATGPTVLTMAGDAGDNLPLALRRATLLRVADCHLLPGRDDHFLQVQRDRWAPGMAAAGGMLAGAVTRLAPHRHLVTTLWTSPTAHARYAADHLPGLLARAELDADLHGITGHVLPLEPTWRVSADT
ncbi:DUF4937 domain-containing protein [Kitasatospora sp. NPDC101183]|uniref:DUF4937 domain-containing protein n=1 Tax=Kitasatospora sp. NPDC101183 TaxID=3364100 RepID=UPI0038189A65